MITEILTNEWFYYALSGFAANGFITQAVALTKTKKDDEILGVVGVVLKALTGTFGLVKK